MHHWREGNVRDAIGRFKLVIRLQPDHARAHYQLGACQLSVGDTDAALVNLKRAVAMDERFVEPRYVLAVQGEGEVVDRVPVSIVENKYNNIASRYESQYVVARHYRGVMSLRDVLAPLFVDHGNLEILDLGCGSGLCGDILRPHAAYLEGVDISKQMLALAYDKKRDSNRLYDSLKHNDIVRYLEEERTRLFDVVVAAGVVDYFGDVAPLFEKISQALKSGGMFAVTVQKHDGDDAFSLISDEGRFSHNPGYVERVAVDAGFVLEQAVEMPLYKDCPGLLFVFRR